MDIKQEKIDCQCNKCQGACQNKPGWFLPDEIEKAAKYLNLTVKEFFDKYLGVDWWEAYEKTFILAPAITRMGAGGEYPGNPKGTCVFFKDGKCSIHDVKPYECREHIHTESHEDCVIRHAFVKDQWANKDAQKKIKDLLGREPQTEEYSWLDSLFN